MIRLQTLGSIDLQAGETTLSSVLAQPKRLALLTFLVTARPVGFHSRDTILALFWPESDTERARNSLRQALHHLRRHVGESALVSRGDRDVGINPALFACDANRFDEAIENGQLEQALAEYRGDFLPGLHVQEADEAMRWVDDERLRRKRLALNAAIRLAEMAADNNEPHHSAQWARRALEIEASDETAMRHLLTALEQIGDIAGAVDAYSEFAKRLDGEFGIKPSIETTRLVQQITARPVTTTAEVAALSPRPVSPVRNGTGTRGTQIPEFTTPEAGASVPANRPRSILASWLRPAAFAAVVVASIWFGISAMDRSPSGTSTPASLATLAVLPFVNLSNDAGNDVLADGMTEELLNLLAQRPELQVAARTSSFAFKNKNVPIDSIARILRVQHVVEGSVRQSGGQWRFTVQLIDALSGYHRWSATFDTHLNDVIAVQDSIGRAIVAQLRIQLADAGTAPVARFVSRPARDSAATIATMKGWRVFRLNTPEAYAAAAEHFLFAMQRDPQSAYAYAGLATVRHWQAYFRQLPADSTYEVARALAHHALSLDSTVADAWLVLGRTAEVRDRNDTLAIQYYQRAVHVAPSDPRPYSRRAAALARLGDTQSALASAQHAVQLDPASPAVYSDLANLYGDMNRFPDAEQALRQALSLDPGHPILLGNLAIQLANQKRFAAADTVIAAVRKQRADDPTAMGQHAFVLANLSKVSHARALLDSAEQRGLSHVQLALTYLVLGDTGAVYRQLERALEVRDDGLPMVLDTTLFAGIRSQPRYQSIAERVRSRADQ